MQSARKSVNRLKKTDANTDCVKNSRCQLISTPLVCMYVYMYVCMYVCKHLVSV